MNDKQVWALAAVADQAREVAKLIQRLGQQQPNEASGAMSPPPGPDPELRGIESQLTNISAAIEAYLRKHPPSPGQD